MTFEYFPDTDTVYIALRPGPGADAAEVSTDVILDFDAEGNVVGVTIEHASERSDLSSFVVRNMPVTAVQS